MKAKCEHGASAVCVCGVCYCSTCFPGETCPDCKRDYFGLDERAAYLQWINSVEGGTVSPGGAAAILNVSRQRIHALMSEGKVRFWRYFSRESKLPEMVDVSIRDIVRHGVFSGGIRSYEDFGLRGYLVRQEWELLMGVDQEQPAAVA